jgi:hypothetical protein
MKANAYGVFKLDRHNGSMKLKSDHATFDEAEDSINIPADLMSTVTYVILPLYTNSEVKPTAKRGGSKK